MRIVYVLTSLGMGGAERQVLEIARRMAARGHAVALLILRPPLAEQWPTSLDVHHLDMLKTFGSVLRGLAIAHRFLADFRPDLLHSHSFHANLFTRLLNISASPRVVSTIHNVYEGGWPRMFAYRLSDFLADQTTAISQAAADRFIRLKAVSARKCIVLTNGIDTVEFSPIPQRREQTRAALHADAAFIWLAAGRIAPAKDYPNLLHAFARVRASEPTSVLWIAGEASTGVPNSEAAQLLNLATELGISNSIRWLGLHRDMPALLDAVDGFVLASAWEGMPLALGEAMAMRKPIVATDVGGVRELAGETGILVAPKDPAALADAMLRTMRTSAEDRLILGRTARERICANFSIDAKVNEWESLYRSLQLGAQPSAQSHRA
jgi:glycosyltransferase involved in cell wall biosynthesis